jgi:Leucine Rich repeat
MLLVPFARSAPRIYKRAAPKAAADYSSSDYSSSSGDESEESTAKSRGSADTNDDASTGASSNDEATHKSPGSHTSNGTAGTAELSYDAPHPEGFGQNALFTQSSSSSGSLFSKLSVVSDYRSLRDAKTGHLFFMHVAREQKQLEAVPDPAEPAPVEAAPEPTAAAPVAQPLPAVALAASVASSGSIKRMKAAGRRRWKKFQAFRLANRTERRYATLDWFEERIEQQAAAAAAEEIVEREQRRAQWLAAQQRERAQAETRRFVKALRRDDAARQQRESAVMLAAEQQRAVWLRSNSVWRAEDEQRALQAAAAVAAAATAAATAAEQAALSAKRLARAEKQQRDVDEGNRYTQEVLQTMRKAGVIAAVNAPARQNEQERPRETQTELTIWLKPGAVLPHIKSASKGSSKKHAASAGTTASQQQQQQQRVAVTQAGAVMKSPQRAPRQAQLDAAAAAAAAAASCPFNHNLSDFRSVMRLRVTGELGRLGGAALAQSIVYCSRLTELRLPWCALTDSGLTVLLAALCSGSTQQLAVLDLRHNCLTAASLTTLGDKLRTTPALQLQLRDVDLSGNALCDEGGRVLAHQFLQGGVYNRVTHLRLRSTGMQDAGVSAVFKALTAMAHTLSPELQLISLRDNAVSSAVHASMQPMPHFLQL